jgi:hypothetical protein
MFLRKVIKVVKTISIKVPDELYYELKRKKAEMRCDRWLDFILKVSGIFPTTSPKKLERPIEKAEETETNEIDVKKEIEAAYKSFEKQERKASKQHNKTVIHSNMEEIGS